MNSVTRRARRAAILAPVLAFVIGLAFPLAASASVGEGAPWWVWPIALFVATFLLGIVATLAGVGGGVLFVPIVGSLFPFHLDFVRGAGLLLALASAMSASPMLLRAGFASLRVAMPLAVVGSITSIAGAMTGLLVPIHLVEVSLGVAVLAIAALMLRSRRGEDASAPGSMDAIARALGLAGRFTDGANGRAVDWAVQRTATGIALFAGIGFLAGFFGIGAGWANVPVLNLVMALPLKVSVATSSLAISMINTSAAWVYLAQGAVLPMLTVPAILGAMIGARIGSKLVRVVSAATIRRVVVAILLVAGVRVLAKGLGWWN